jgi:hypothetical protein
MLSNIKVVNTKIAHLMKMYISCFGNLFIRESEKNFVHGNHISHLIIMKL